jgi:hypothetical protein
MSGLDARKIRALVYIVAFAALGALATFGVLTIEDAERYLFLAGGLLGMGATGLSLKNLEKAPGVVEQKVEQKVRAEQEPAPAGGLAAVIDRLQDVAQKVELVAGMIAPRNYSVVSGAPFAVPGAPETSTDNPVTVNALRARLDAEARATAGS